MKLSITAAGQVHEMPLEEGSISIGRGPRNDLPLADPDVSRRQCLLVHEADGKTQLIDLCSRNGTWVNGQRIQRRELVPGDTIQLGDTLLVLSEPQSQTQIIDFSESAILDDSSILTQSEAFKGFAATQRRRPTNTHDAKGKDERRRRIQQLVVNSQRIAAELDLKRLLDTALTAVMDDTGAERGLLLLVGDAGTLHFASGTNFDAQALEGPDGQWVESLRREAAASQDIVLHRRSANASPSPRTGSCVGICLPLVSPSRYSWDQGSERRRDRKNARICGYIIVENRAQGLHIGTADRQILKAMASQAAIALHNAFLYRQATVEPLTGLLNRDSFRRLFNEELHQSQGEQQPLSLLMLDVDHFKSVNDGYGHPVGDQVLRELSQRIKDSLRRDDLVGRYGGEEFIVALPRTDAESARKVAEKIRAIVGTMPMSESKLNITISLGLAVTSTEAETMETLIQRADQALYAAKRAGRNRVIPWSPTVASLGHEPSESTERRLARVERELKLLESENTSLRERLSLFGKPILSDAILNKPKESVAA